eukprot:TRINITY_DN2003_c0_g1_i2.p1 TRINITY_DN2003_c0_g1~~TRINITY_DN2003_c0_g1_i2.p1  ORF type:complete len:627 (-),score=115.82 TRINITY_DN2003_c0_g1_i2:58-1875(-)
MACGEPEPKRHRRWMFFLRARQHDRETESPEPDAETQALAVQSDEARHSSSCADDQQEVRLLPMQHSQADTGTGSNPRVAESLDAQPEDLAECSGLGLPSDDVENPSDPRNARQCASDSLPGQRVDDVHQARCSSPCADDEQEVRLLPLQHSSNPRVAESLDAQPEALAECPVEKPSDPRSARQCASDSLPGQRVDDVHQAHPAPVSCRSLAETLCADDSIVDLITQLLGMLFGGKVEQGDMVDVVKAHVARLDAPLLVGVAEARARASNDQAELGNLKKAFTDARAAVSQLSVAQRDASKRHDFQKSEVAASFRAWHLARESYGDYESAVDRKAALGALYQEQYVPLRDGAAQEDGSRASLEKLRADLKKYNFETSLVTAATVALSSWPRSEFGKTALQHLEKAVKKCFSDDQHHEDAAAAVAAAHSTYSSASAAFAREAEELRDLCKQSSAAEALKQKLRQKLHACRAKCYRADTKLKNALNAFESFRASLGQATGLLDLPLVATDLASKSVDYNGPDKLVEQDSVPVDPPIPTGDPTDQAADESESLGGWSEVQDEDEQDEAADEVEEETEANSLSPGTFRAVLTEVRELARGPRISFVGGA